MSIRILIVDDHQILREGLSALLHAQLPDVQIAEACDGREAIRMAAQWSPDIIVMDISMPHLNGLDATREILATNTHVEVVFLSAHSSGTLTNDALNCGASGYVSKDSAFEELTAAIRSILDGDIYISPKIKAAMADGNGTGPRNGAPQPLSTRERQVLQRVANGSATKEIARDMDLSVKTIETHRRRIMEKLDLYSVAELTRYALREGLIQ